MENYLKISGGFIMIFKPVLRNCSPNGDPPETNAIAGEPENWFTDDLLDKYQLKQISFDFFVDWSNNKVSSEFWVKRIADSEPIEPTTTNVQQKIYDCDGKDYVMNLAGFANGNLKYKIFREGTNWDNYYNNPDLTPTPILDVLIDESGKVTEVKKIKLQTLMTQIRVLSGGPVRIGRKGLGNAFTDLECYLKGTDALWPGDADMVLLNESNEAIAILEFKKHTLDAKIEKRMFGRYYPNPDGRKYNRLALLRDSINDSIPIIMIYYPTKEHHSYILVERIDGSFKKLFSSKIIKLDLPVDLAQREKLIETILYLL